MDNETIEDLTAAIRTLSHNMSVQSEILESLSAREADLISEMKLLRNVIEASSKQT